MFVKRLAITSTRRIRRISRAYSSSSSDTLAAPYVTFGTNNPPSSSSSSSTTTNLHNLISSITAATSSPSTSSKSPASPQQPVPQEVKSAPRKPVGPSTFIQKKNAGEKITMMTAYDISSATLCENAGIDSVLVGDSVGNVIQGKNGTRTVTMEDIIYHLRCVAPRLKTCLLVGDMPFGSYEISPTQAVENAIRLVKEGGASSVKLEGFHPEAIRSIVNAGIPVVAHLGLLPQTATLKTGSFNTTGTTASDAMILLDQALKVQEAGAFSIVLECVAAPVAAYVTSQLRIPTIGIGSGGGTSGQVLVFHDALGLFTDFQPKFVHRFADLGSAATKGLEDYVQQVKAGKFPSHRHSFSISPTQWEAFESRVLAEADAGGEDVQSHSKALAVSIKYNPRPRATQQQQQQQQAAHAQLSAIPAAPLRIAVVGGGSLGSLVAATLAKQVPNSTEAIVDVTLVTRWQKHREVIQEQGLRLLNSDGQVSSVSSVNAINYPSSTDSISGPLMDVVIVCVKTPETQVAGEAAAPLLKRGGICLTLQNGLGNVEVLRKLVPTGVAVAQGVTTAGAALQGPGHVRLNGTGKTELALAVCSSNPSDNVCSICNCGAQHILSRIATAFVSRGLPCELSGDATATLWKKLAVSCGVNAVTALLRLTNGDVASAEPAARVVALAAAEAARVARVYGVELDPEAAAQSALAVARDTAHNTSSMLCDLLQGKPTEVDAINRAVVIAGQSVSVQCPVNAALADLVSAAAATAKRRIPDAIPMRFNAGAAVVPMSVLSAHGVSTSSSPSIRTVTTTATTTPSEVVILRTIAQVREWVSKLKDQKKKVGFVPTMGYLHSGHLSLVESAKNNGCDAVIASIFVNPKQFAAHEDLGTYPRDIDGDIKKLQSVGTAAVWIPEVAEMYPDGFSTEVRVTGPLTERLCGKSRPHFFGGVATVVLKLLICVNPDIAVFGSKDYQQVLVVQRMVEDLCLPVKIVPAPTMREHDGVAMSSRNARLSPEGRKNAPTLYQSLCKAKELHAQGERRPGVLRRAALEVMERNPNVKVDYVDILHGKTLVPLEEDVKCNEKMVMAIAAVVAGVRLIDNITFE